MRRPSLGLGTHHKSESKTSLSDSSTTKGSNLKVGTTLQPEVTPLSVVSPVAESPAREAEASRSSPIVAPSPLGAIPVSQPQETPVHIPVVSEPPAPEPELQVTDSPPNLVDSPKAQEPSLSVVEQAPGNLLNYVEPQPIFAETPEMVSREVREEPDPIQPQAESGFDLISTTARAEEPEPVSIPVPEPAPVTIQVPEQQAPPTQVVSDVGGLPLLGPTTVTVPPPEDQSPWANVITRNDNISSQPLTPPNHPRSLSPKQSRASFAGTVFESVNASQQSLPRQVSNKPSKTSLAPSYTWHPKADPQQRYAPQVVDHGTNGDARTVSSARYGLCVFSFFKAELKLLTRFTADDPFVDPPLAAQPIPYLYPSEELSEYVSI